MADNKKHVLVVDDEPANLFLMLKVLETLFRVTCSESGQDCLNVIENDPPDLVLLDVRMPEMDGYECCRKIKEHEELGHIPVVFLSGQTQIEDKLKGYEAGGSDYLTKPCDIREVVDKVNHNLLIVSQYQKQIIRAHAAVNSSDFEELNDVLQFVMDSLKCNNQEALARLILNTLQRHNFNACVQLKGEKETLNLTLNGPCAPLEVSLMSDVMGSETSFELGHRSLSSLNNVSLLVKNLPQGDVGQCGRIKEHVSAILEGASARMDNLNTVYENERRIVNHVMQSITQIKTALDDLEIRTDKKNTDMTDVFYNLNANIHKSFMELDLTVEQEDHFLELLNQTMYEILDLTDKENTVKDQFRNIGSQLFDITDNKLH